MQTVQDETIGRSDQALVLMAARIAEEADVDVIVVVSGGVPSGVC